MTIAYAEPYPTLNKTWKAACRTILEGEVGELAAYDGWLSEHMAPLDKRTSSVSGKEVFAALPDYSEGAPFIALDEIDFNKKFEPLSVNQIKDIDSIIEAIGERNSLAYCGNVVLGNSKNVGRSSDVQNSHHVYNSNFVYDSEYVAYSSYVRGSKYLFAVVSDFGCSFLIRVFETHKQSRCFEAWKCYDSSDCYFSSCVQGSNEVMFSFNLKNKHHTIGNIDLQKDEYHALKKKLLAEIRDELVRNKRLPSLMGIVAASAKPKVPKGFKVQKAKNQFDLSQINNAFGKTTSLVLGKNLDDLQPYGKWLSRHVPKVTQAQSAATGHEMFVSDVNPCNLFPKDRLADSDEIWELGKIMHLDDSEIESFGNIKSSIGRIAFVNPNGQLGECKNLCMVPLANTSMNCYCCPIASFNEYAAFSYWPRSSKYIFGSALTFSSNFCINTYYSVNLSRALEVDGSSNCSDVAFVHNCENVHDSLFCFNAKNLRFAIGNAPLNQEKYRTVRTTVMDQIATELEKNKTVEWDIFTLAERGQLA